MSEETKKAKKVIAVDEDGQPAAKPEKVVGVKRDGEIVRDIIARLHKVEGQTKGLTSMVEEGRTCDALLEQVTAIRSSMAGIARLLLEEHMMTNIINRLRGGEDEAIAEYMQTLRKSGF
jgi:DNA-binding FrmR family transcriptional regulator